MGTVLQSLRVEARALGSEFVAYLRVQLPYIYGG